MNQEQHYEKPMLDTQARGDRNHPFSLQAECTILGGVMCVRKKSQKVRWHCPTHKSDLCPTCYGRRVDGVRASMKRPVVTTPTQDVILSLPQTEQELNALNPDGMRVILKEQKRDASACGT